MNKNYSLKTAPTALSKEQKSQNRPKAKRIVIGVDVHLKSYHAACKIDNGAIGAVAKFRSQTELLLYIEKQLQGGRGSGSSLRSGALGLCAVPRVGGSGGQMLCLWSREHSAAKQAT